MKTAFTSPPSPLPSTPAADESIQSRRAADFRTQLRGQPYEAQARALAPVQMFKTYRGGSSTDANLTPRASKDTSGNKRGLSTFQEPQHILDRSPSTKKAQEIETDDLGDELLGIANGTGPDDSHVSIRPARDEDLVEWSNSRDKGNHRYTQAVRRAIRREVALPLKKDEPPRDNAPDDKAQAPKTLEQKIAGSSVRSPNKQPSGWGGQGGRTGGGGASSSW